MRKSLPYFLLSLLLLLYSCDVGLHDNFVEIEPLPTEIPIYVNLDVETDNEGVLQIFESTSIHYQISKPEAEFLRAAFYVNEICIHETTDLKGTFRPYYYSIPKEFQIKCVVTMKPKDRYSISDQVNARLYEGKIRWNAQMITSEFRFYQNPGDITPENITVRWETNVPNCSFRINYRTEVLASNTKETSISVPTPPFGSSKYLNVEVFSQNGENIYFPHIERTSFLVTFGTVLKKQSMKSIYSFYSNTLYASMNKEVTSYSVPELTVFNEYNNENSYDNACIPIAVAPNSDKMAIKCGSFMQIFTNRDLKQQVKIDNPDDMADMPSKVFFTTNDKLAVFYNTHYPPTIYSYNASNGNLEKSIPVNIPLLDQHSPDFTNCQISEQFLCIPLQSIHKIAIVPLQDFQTGEPIIYDWRFKQLFMDPNFPDRLILDNTGRVDIVNCRNGQTIESVYKGDNWTLCNIDPKTGNYLFQSGNYLIIKNKNSEELFRLKTDDVIAYPHLDNNILTCQKGIALNVESYLKKK